MFDLIIRISIFMDCTLFDSADFKKESPGLDRPFLFERLLAVPLFDLGCDEL